MPLAKLIGIECPATRSNSSANQGAFLSTGEATYSGARNGGSGNRQFISVFFHETAMSAITITPRLRGADRPNCKHKR